MMSLNINGLEVETTGDVFTRVINKPFIGTTERIQYIKIDDVYIYFPPGKVIITKEDINKF